MSDFYGNESEKEIPVTSNYLKFEVGENKFRILGSFADGSAKRGLQYFKTVNGKPTPIRVTPETVVPASEIELNKFGDPSLPVFFWAFPVWNYQDKRIQIATINQKTILRAIQGYIDNPKWGNPRDYDFIVTKVKTGDKTDYTVSVDPKEPLDPAIEDMYNHTTIDMEAWFRSEDPFLVK